MTKQQPASYWVEKLDLLPHSEGGYFKEMFHSAEQFQADEERLRHHYSSIYFLLNQESPSHFHRLKSDEIWYYHTGSPLSVHLLHPDGHYERIQLGLDAEAGQVLQAVVPKNVIFGSSIEDEGDYALVSCMVSPGFDYHDFELFTKAELLTDYPTHHEIIEKLAYETIPESN